MEILLCYIGHRPFRAAALLKMKYKKVEANDGQQLLQLLQPLHITAEQRVPLTITYHYFTIFSEALHYLFLGSLYSSREPPALVEAVPHPLRLPLLLQPRDGPHRSY